MKNIRPISARSNKKINRILMKKVGDWDGTIDFLNDFDKNVRKAYTQSRNEIYKKLIKKVTGHILKQDLPWEPLSPHTTGRKHHNRIYEDTLTLLANIGVFGTGNNKYVGIRRGVTYRRKGQKVTAEQVARWMEFGTKRMVARPLWGPSVQEMGGAYGIRNKIAKDIYNELNKKPGAFKITYQDIRRRVPR